MRDESAQVDVLLVQAEQGDREPLVGFLQGYRDRLLRMVRLRMDRRLLGRIDASDVVQEAYADACDRLEDYLRKRDMPLFLWLRFLTAQRLLILHRRHLGTAARDAGREVSIHRGALPEATSAALAAQLIGRQTSPTRAARRAEMKIRLERALNAMEPIDREVLALRHFEQLTNVQAAQTLDIPESAASKRYVRALVRLKKLLTGMSGEVES